MRKITNSTKFWVGQKLYNNKQLDKYHTITQIIGNRVWVRYSDWSNGTGPYNYPIKKIINEKQWYTHDITEYFEAINNQ